MSTSLSTTQTRDLFVTKDPAIGRVLKCTTAAGKGEWKDETLFEQVNADWEETSGPAEILNKPLINVGAFATDGSGARIIDDAALFVGAGSPMSANSVFAGHSTTSAEDNVVVIGTLAQVYAGGAGSVVIGNASCFSSSSESVAIGYKAEIDSLSAKSVAIGYQAYVFNSAENSVVIGRAQSSAASAVVIGNGSSVGGYAESGVAIGAGATSTGSSSIAIGNGAISDTQDGICIGTDATLYNSDIYTTQISFGKQVLELYTVSDLNEFNYAWYVTLQLGSTNNRFRIPLILANDPGSA